MADKTEENMATELYFGKLLLMFYVSRNAASIMETIVTGVCFCSHSMFDGADLQVITTDVVCLVMIDC